MSNLRSEIVLSVSRALLGEVFPELIAVAGRIDTDRKFELIFFVDAVLSDSQAEDVACVETEVIADFPDDFEISHTILVAQQVGLPASDAFWIFQRKRL